MVIIITPAKYLIFNPVRDIFQLPKIALLDHAAGLVYLCDKIYGTPSYLPLFLTEYDINDTKEPIPTEGTVNKLLMKNRILKSGLAQNLYTVVSMYALDISDLETILDNEVEEFILRTRG